MHKFTKESSINPKTLGAGTVTKDPQMSGATVQNLVTMATLSPVFVQSLIIPAIIRRHLILKL